MDCEQSMCNLTADSQHVINIAYSHFKSKMAACDPFPEVSGSIEDYTIKALNRAQEQTGMSVAMDAYDLCLVCTWLVYVALALPAMVFFFLFLFAPLFATFLLTVYVALCKPGCAVSAADTSSV